jgi:hypothetical protein
MATTNDRPRAGQKPVKKPSDKPLTDRPLVTYTCGHKIGLAHLAGRACPECVNKARRQKNRERALARRPQLHGRLPDGSSFLLTYDAAAECWGGTLEVSGVGSFSGRAVAVFGLLKLLDEKYRAAVAGKAVTP